jgi:hypothetical protein
MVVELKLRKVGNSVGLVLPKEALARMNVEEGDAIYSRKPLMVAFGSLPTIPGLPRK